MKAVILGTAQDAGIPQTLCSCRSCRRAATDPSLRRTAACLALVEEHDVWLVDATPDLRYQLMTLGPDVRLRGVLLTHGHMGHIAGLLQLGKEGPHARVSLHATPRLVDALFPHPPFSFLREHLEVRRWKVGAALDLGGFEVLSHPVVHRGELADTIAIEVRGPSRRLLYMPDTDAFDATAMNALDGLRAGDVAIVDGTFHSNGELGHRDMDEVPHPLIRDSIKTIAPMVQRGVRVVFTHLNHTNPLCMPDAAEAGALHEAGFEVAVEGAFVDL